MPASRAVPQSILCGQQWTRIKVQLCASGSTAPISEIWDECSSAAVQHTRSLRSGSPRCRNINAIRLAYFPSALFWCQMPTPQTLQPNRGGSCPACASEPFLKKCRNQISSKVDSLQWVGFFLVGALDGTRFKKAITVERTRDPLTVPSKSTSPATRDLVRVLREPSSQPANIAGRT